MRSKCSLILVPELMLRHRLARITRIARAIPKTTASLALVSLASPSAALPSASSLPISLPAHVAFLLLFFY
jgi:hypothetical protein